MDTEPKEANNFLDLDSLVLLDESQIKEGFEDGYKDGLVSGKEEGREVGLKQGFQVGEELGFYKGCLDIWNSVIHANAEAFSSRVRKRIQELAELVGQYPLMDPENESVQEVMENIRLKFKIISANLRVKLEYEGQTKSLNQGLEDI